MISPVSTPAPVALLVDGENIAHDLAGRAIARAIQMGPLQVMRVYGNVSRLGGWAEAERFRVIHCPSAKNAADMCLTIDAMRLALSEGFRQFAILSSDSDFTPLAITLRELGARVLGLGDSRAPERFRKACAEFVDLTPPQVVKVPVKTTEVSKAAAEVDDQRMKDRALRILSDMGREATITSFGAAMRKKYDIQISGTRFKDWRRFFNAYPKHFSSDPKGPEAKVRLIGPAAAPAAAS